MLNVKEDILKNAFDGAPIDFHSIFPPLWKSMRANNCFVLQNNYFCVQHKKETYTGLEQYEGE